MTCTSRFPCEHTYLLTHFLCSPLNIIGMPFFREKLLSAWGNERYFEVGKPPPVIDPAILKNLRPNPGGIGQIAPNPRKSIRNQAEESKPGNANDTVLATPKLLSEKARDPKYNLGSSNPNKSAAEALLKSVLSDNTKADVPNYYANLTIQFGPKLGIEDFDFKYVCPINCLLLAKLGADTTTRHATLA